MEVNNAIESLNKLEKEYDEKLMYRIELRALPLTHNPSVYCTATEDELRMAVEISADFVSVSHAWKANNMAPAQFGYMVMAIDEIAFNNAERRLYERRQDGNFISMTIQALLRQRTGIVYAE